MTLSLRTFLATGLRRRIALVMALAVLCAGIAQAAHFHRDELAQHNDVQCLLCLHAAGNAGPPDLPRPVVIAPVHYAVRVEPSTETPVDVTSVGYRPRGPPVA